MKTLTAALSAAALFTLAAIAAAPAALSESPHALSWALYQWETR